MLIRNTATITLTVVGVLIGIYLIFLLRDVVILFALAIMLASAVRPLVVRVYRNTKSQILAILVVYTALLFVVFLLGLLVIPPFVDQMQQLFNSAPEFVTQVQVWLNSLQLFFGGIFPAPNLADTLPQLIGQLPVVAGGLLRITLNLFSVLFTIGLAVVISIYWLIYYDTVRRTALRAIPRSRRPIVNEGWRETEDRLGAFVRGEILLGTAVGIMTFAGLEILGVPFSLVLAIFAAITELIPMVGPYIGAIPAIIVALTVSPSLTLWVVLLYVIVQQIENHILVPNVMRLVIGLNPLLVLFSLLAGGVLLGLVGAILAVPLAAIIQVLARLYLKEEEEKPETLERDNSQKNKTPG